LSLNGEAWGLYLAVEVYNDSYEERVSGDTSGALYNVKMSMGMDMQGGMQGRPQMGQGGQDMTLPEGTEGMVVPEGGEAMMPPEGAEGMTPPEGEEGSISPQDRPDLSNLPQDFTENGFRGNNNMGSRNGGSLVYTDDEVSSYSDIFDNVVGKSDEASETHVVEALKALSTGEDLEEYFGVDEILRYLAAHTVVANFDSYSSSMAQNYYIYEKEGLLTILPWDYNMAWGGFQGSDASTVVNFPIDTPVLGVELSERPLIEKLLQNEDYLASYHSYLEELMTEYFAEGQFEAKVRELDSLIKSYVESDPTAFCTYEEYQKAVEALIQLGTLRYESIMGQLNGEIPATTAGQEASPELLISSDTVNLSDLGNSKFGKEGMRP
ncbi:MAG: CotH kinase family protein, partial [Vallitaleaceae bacterium]|nr:CotH kinase family protein [Vallitaleaceae bacterium]